MKIALSTNWFGRGADDGARIAEKALELGFDELELGFATTPDQVPGFRRMLGRMPVGSVHAFCPVPISAPQGHPELYSLASFDADARALAAFHVRRNIAFAAEMGAGAVVLHAGRVPFATLFRRAFDSGTLRRARADDAQEGAKGAKYPRLLARALKVRAARGAKLLPLFAAEIEKLVHDLERHHVTLALENLPYLEGFPDESELKALVGRFASAPIRGWFDTGHHRVRESFGWLAASDDPNQAKDLYAGMHLNDVVDYDDDHFAPGGGKVDFAGLGELAHSVRHVVFEPKSHVAEEELRRSLAFIRGLWRPAT